MRLKSSSSPRSWAFWGAEMRFVLVGHSVVVDASKEAGWGYVDGWRGVVTGINNGLYEVTCTRSDGMKTLYIPPELLRVEGSR